MAMGGAVARGAWLLEFYLAFVVCVCVCVHVHIGGLSKPCPMVVRLELYNGPFSMEFCACYAQAHAHARAGARARVSARARTRCLLYTSPSPRD